MRLILKARPNQQSAFINLSKTKHHENPANIDFRRRILCDCYGTILPPPPDYQVLISIPDTTILSNITPQGKPVFRNQEINDIFDQYTVTAFDKEHPTSRFTVMRQIYKFNTDDTALCNALKASFPLYFPFWELRKQGELLTDYYPNDFVKSWPVNPDYLSYIKAPTAWGITHGDPNVIIGITDTYLDTYHPDLQYKMAMVSSNTASTGAWAPHGTQVTGAAVAATDNGTGYPAIGFNCRVDFSGKWASDNELLLMSQRDRKILTGSWMYGHTPDLQLHYNNQVTYQEIYENGTLTCIAAGNQPNPWWYAYPASYDYVFSTSGVGWELERDGVNTFNVKGVHQINLGDTSDSHHHNSRVDLLAPSVRVGSLTYEPDNPTKKYAWDEFWGTSIASPQTAGTAGLMLSVKPCLTPYQMEYILKKSANSSILSYPENLKYAGRLGAGALDAGAAASMAQGFNCNSAATQTFYIEGVEFNTLCAPGFASNSVLPQLTPILKNGTPPYTYRWEYVPGNTATLNSLTSATPTITAATPDGSGKRVASLRLTVYDASSVQKVASKFFYLELRTANDYDLATRDHYMDMLDEPNSMEARDPRDWNIWLSPDLWNRKNNDGGTVPQNPIYNTSGYNYAHVRVRNVGCAPSPSSGNQVRLYWSKASTGEIWKNDWDGTTQVAAAGGGVIPAGGELTAGAPLAVPALQPGQQAILVQPWQPVNPQDFAGSPTNMDACLLSRIEDTHGMTIPEIYYTAVTPNVRNNNNIVTRNLIFTTLIAEDAPIATHQVFVANADLRSTAYDLQLINERSINPHFAGDFSSVGYITLYLGDLYDIWMNGGGNGTYASRNAQTRTVVFDGAATLLLENLMLPPDVKYPVALEFTLHNGAQVPDYAFTVHLRQFRHNAQVQDVYGNVSFQINTEAGSGVSGRPGGSEPLSVGSVETDKGGFSIYPNPVNDQLTIAYQNGTEVIANVTVIDITGRTLISRKEQWFEKSALEINTKELAPGVYFLNIADGKGLNQQFKFVKK